MDSKLVVEQMSGRWKIKHPDMRPLAAEATRLAPFGTTYTWVPREQNKHADRLANEALDGKRDGVTAAGAALVDEPAPSRPSTRRTAGRAAGAAGGPATTLVLVRHGVTPHTAAKRFSGGLASSNPGLSDEGRAQVRATADWLAPIAERRRRGGRLAGTPHPASPPRSSPRCWARPVEVEPGFAEMEFGRWDGLTFAEVAERDQAEPRRLARLDRRRRRRAASRSGRSRSGCWPGSTGCSRRTPARRWSWSAT